MSKNKKYNVSYFLAALGNGGLVVSFFMYLLFMVKHPKNPIPVFDDIYNVFNSSSIYISGLIVISMLGIIYFTIKHFSVLTWNIKEYLKFKKTDEYKVMKTTNAEINLMMIPLTLAMSVNVLFILGAIFIPNLWTYVEYLFPFSLLAFGIIGIYALKIFITYLTRIIVAGTFDFTTNNNLNQLLSSFTFAMIAVGFAASAAMSEVLVTSVIGMFGAILFMTIAVLFLLIGLVLGFKSIFKHGISKEGSPSLLILIPIGTIFGITLVRLISGISHNLLHIEPSPVIMFVVLSIIISLQIVIAIIGYIVLKKAKYFEDYVNGKTDNASSYSLICPGVALFVLGMFFIHWGLVKTDIIDIFSIAYFIIIAPYVFVQIKTILLLSKLNKKLM